MGAADRRASSLRPRGQSALPTPRLGRNTRGQCRRPAPPLSRVHIKSSFIMNGVCVRYRGWIDLDRLDGVGCLEYDEERGRLEDAVLRDQIECYNQRLRDFEEKQRAFRARHERQAEAELERVRRKTAVAIIPVPYSWPSPHRRTHLPFVLDATVILGGFNPCLSCPSCRPDGSPPQDAPGSELPQREADAFRAGVTLSSPRLRRRSASRRRGGRVPSSSVPKRRKEAQREITGDGAPFG
ncbi:hypothetical protein HPB50_021145 [Hyalomma asiaticum]|uniref:Uncharacterized protein n=1 Tax=Hyalomma asiaticum TaxID=266040 RepID=A0ACB7TSA7_HYAAI|nr:hypothetical protein HPB50_021145 [Hyalomma asiaticum]